MRYVCLIYHNETAQQQMTEAEQKQQMDDYWAFTRDINEAGVNKGGEALMPIATATTVRVRNSEILTTDGPFAETKEQLGGYYVLDCDNLDEAISWAAKIPDAKGGSIEVRPIVEWD